MATTTEEARVIRLTVAHWLNLERVEDRKCLRQVAAQEAAQPRDLVRVSHRGGLVVYRLDRLARLRVVTEYRCG